MFRFLLSISSLRIARSLHNHFSEAREVGAAPLPDASKQKLKFLIRIMVVRARRQRSRTPVSSILRRKARQGQEDSVEDALKTYSPTAKGAETRQEAGLSSERENVQSIVTSKIIDGTAAVAPISPLNRKTTTLISADEREGVELSIDASILSVEQSVTILPEVEVEAIITEPQKFNAFASPMSRSSWSIRSETKSPKRRFFAPYSRKSSNPPSTQKKELIATSPSSTLHTPKVSQSSSSCSTHEDLVQAVNNKAESTQVRSQETVGADKLRPASQDKTSQKGCPGLGKKSGALCLNENFVDGTESGKPDRKPENPNEKVEVEKKKEEQSKKKPPRYAPTKTNQPVKGWQCNQENIVTSDKDEGKASGVKIVVYDSEKKSERRVGVTVLGTSKTVYLKGENIEPFLAVILREALRKNQNIHIENGNVSDINGGSSGASVVSMTKAVSFVRTNGGQWAVGSHPASPSSHQSNKKIASPLAEQKSESHSFTNSYVKRVCSWNTDDGSVVQEIVSIVDKQKAQRKSYPDGEQITTEKDQGEVDYKYKQDSPSYQAPHDTGVSKRQGAPRHKTNQIPLKSRLQSVSKRHEAAEENISEHNQGRIAAGKVQKKYKNRSFGKVTALSIPKQNIQEGNVKPKNANTGQVSPLQLNNTSYPDVSSFGVETTSGFSFEHAGQLLAEQFGIKLEKETKIAEATTCAKSVSDTQNNSLFLEVRKPLDSFGSTTWTGQEIATNFGLLRQPDKYDHTRTDARQIVPSHSYSFTSALQTGQAFVEKLGLSLPSTPASTRTKESHGFFFNSNFEGEKEEPVDASNQFSQTLGNKKLEKQVEDIRAHENDSESSHEQNSKPLCVCLQQEEVQVNPTSDEITFSEDDPTKNVTCKEKMAKNSKETQGLAPDPVIPAVTPNTQNNKEVNTANDKLVRLGHKMRMPEEQGTTGEDFNGKAPKSTPIEAKMRQNSCVGVDDHQHNDRSEKQAPDQPSDQVEQILGGNEEAMPVEATGDNSSEDKQVNQNILSNDNPDSTESEGLPVVQTVTTNLSSHHQVVESKKIPLESPSSKTRAGSSTALMRPPPSDVVARRIKHSFLRRFCLGRKNDGLKVLPVEQAKIALREAVQRVVETALKDELESFSSEAESTIKYKLSEHISDEDDSYKSFEGGFTFSSSYLGSDDIPEDDSYWNESTIGYDDSTLGSSTIHEFISWAHSHAEKTEKNEVVVTFSDGLDSGNTLRMLVSETKDGKIEIIEGGEKTNGQNLDIECRRVPSFGSRSLMSEENGYHQYAEQTTPLMEAFVFYVEDTLERMKRVKKKKKEAATKVKAKVDENLNYVSEGLLQSLVRIMGKEEPKDVACSRGLASTEPIPTRTKNEDDDEDWADLVPAPTDDIVRSAFGMLTTTLSDEMGDFVPSKMMNSRT